MKLNEIKILKESHHLADYRHNIETMLRETNFLYRGIKLHDGMQDAGIPDTYAYFITPRTAPRTPKGNALAAAISESWTDLPPRNRSSFATGIKGDAGRFGITHLVIPADSANVSAGGKGYGVSITDFNYTDAARTLGELDTELLGLYSNMETWAKRTDYVGPEVDRIKELIAKVPLNDHEYHAAPRYADPRAIAFYEYVLEEIPKLAEATLDSYLNSRVADIEVVKSEMEKIGAHSYTELLTRLTPEDFEIVRADTFADVPVGIGECWWDKPYLAVALDNYTPKEILQRILDSM